MTRQELKQKAKDTLTNKWNECIIVMLFFMGANYISSIVSGISNFLTKMNGNVSGIVALSSFGLSTIQFACSVLILIMTMGYHSFFLKIARKENVTYKELFSKVNYFWKTFGYGLLMMLPSFIIGIIYTIVFVSAVPFYGHYPTPYLSEILIYGAKLVIPLLILTVPIYVILSTVYGMWIYIALDKPELGLIDAMRESKKIMEGHIWEYIVLNLSFIGWNILSIFTGGVLSFYVGPYQSVTSALFYEQIKES